MSADIRNERRDRPARWYQGVDRYAWLVLIVCALGWLFDTMDQNLFNLVRQPSVRELIAHKVPAQSLDAAAKDVGAQITAIFLLGWAAGGFLFGVVGDRLGRTRTMMLTIATYAAFTGLNALVRTPAEYALCRFLTALGVGGEFAAGAALVAEVWPEKSRPMALGTLQALSAVGNMAAALITAALSAVSWRWVFVVGAAPALLVVWIQASLREPDRWRKAKEAAASDAAKRELGSIAALFRDPTLRTNTIAGVLMALAGVGGLWGVGFFMPDLVGSTLKPILRQAPGVAALSPNQQDEAVKHALQWYRSTSFFIQQVGAFLGMFAYAALSQRTGRRPALALFLVLAFASVEGAFWGTRSVVTAHLWAFPLGFCALAPFSAYAVYFPELFPTRLRATGVGFCYNCGRILASVAPFTLGKLSTVFANPSDEAAGMRTAASIVAFVYFVGLIGVKLAPETRDQPLPE
ncbi:MAG: MFS transporter [Chthonomonadales bacterium]